jgi:TIR domain
MVIFLSYASEHLDMADQVKLALVGAGYRVFFDRDSLPAGADYHVRIRKAVQGSDAFVFLISPDAVTPGSYALTELKFARETWPDPTRHVLPVMIERKWKGARLTFKWKGARLTFSAATALVTRSIPLPVFSVGHAAELHASDPLSFRCGQETAHHPTADSDPTPCGYR